MKFTAVIIPSVEEQAGDTTIIDPRGVDRAEVSVMLNGIYETRNLIGRATDVRYEDGRLLADIDIPGWKVAVAGLVREQEGIVIKAMDLMEVSLITERPRVNPE